MKLLTLALAAALVGLPVAGAYAQAAIIEAPPLEGPPGTPLWAPSNIPHVWLSDGNVLPRPKFDNAALAKQTAAAATIPLFSKNVKVDAALGGNTETFTMVGKDPTKAQTNQTTKIKAVIVPVIFTFQPQNVVFDPTKTDACTSKSAEALTLASPAFENITLTVGGKKVGTGQYSDLFQRASFFRFTKPGATNPKFKLILSPVTTAGLAITATNFTVDSAPCGKLGLLDINMWDAYVQATLFPQLKASLTPTTIPIFLFYNVVMYDTTVNNCCILGYHNAFNNPSFGNAFQTYGVAEFDTSQAFGASVADIAVLTHEINELQDDPTINNLTPAWGHTGQVSGCQDNLEVGDPLSGTIFPVVLGGVTYHVQDLAFASWFYRHDAKVTGISGTMGNFGVNGWFSLFGTFKVDAGALCH